MRLAAFGDPVVDGFQTLGLAAVFADALAAEPALTIEGIRLTAADAGPRVRSLPDLRDLERIFTERGEAAGPEDETSERWCDHCGAVTGLVNWADWAGGPEDWHCEDDDACAQRREKRFPPLATPEWIQRGIDAAEAARLTLTAAGIALRQFTGEEGSAGEYLELTWTDDLARQLVRDPQQAEQDIAYMPRDWQTAQGIARARWLAGQLQQQPGQPQAVHAMISNGQGAQHQMLSTPGVREALGIHGAVRHGLTVQGNMPRPLAGSPAAPAPPPAVQQTPAPPAARQPPAPPAARPRPARRRGRGPRYGRA